MQQLYCPHLTPLLVRAAASNCGDENVGSNLISIRAVAWIQWMVEVDKGGGRVGIMTDQSRLTLRADSLGLSSSYWRSPEFWRCLAKTHCTGAARSPISSRLSTRLEPASLEAFSAGCVWRWFRWCCCCWKAESTNVSPAVKLRSLQRHPSRWMDPGRHQKAGWSRWREGGLPLFSVGTDTCQQTA